MPLYDRAFLVITSDAIGSDKGVFEFQHGLETDDRVEKEYLVGNAGTSISEAIRFVTTKVEELPNPSAKNRRQGISVDAGGGQHGGTLTFTTGLEDVTWGDGSGGTGPSNVTQTDASGADVKPRDRLDILQYWIENTLTDSRGQARLHIGQYTDGSYGGVTSGVYDPFPIDILSCEARMPVDEPSNTTVTLEYRQTLVPQFALVDEVADWIGNITDPDWIGGGGTERSDA